MTGKNKINRIDYFFFGIIVILLLFGLAMLYSASTVESYKNFGNTSHYFIHQLVYGAGLGLVAMYFCSRLNYRVWQKVLPALLVISLLSLMLVKIPGLGFSSGGASRWVR